MQENKALCNCLLDFINSFYLYKNFFEASKKAVSLIADELSIGHLTFEYIGADKSLNNFTLFSVDTATSKDYCINRTSSFIENAPINITVYKADRKSDWSDEQKNIINAVMNIIMNAAEKHVQSLILERALFYDGLTQIPNAIKYQKHLSHILRSGQGSLYHTLHLNFKKFKLINEKAGFRGGNSIMIQVVQRINSILLDGEQMFARLGGDNFVALIKNENIPFMTKYLSAVPYSYMLNDKKIEGKIGFYIGIYPINKDDVSLNVVMDRAFAAFSVSKRPESNDIVFFDEEIHRNVMREKNIESNMHNALTDDEFIVFYQPKIDLKENKIVGAEALVRWNKDGHIVPPIEFIPTLEKNGFICEIDFYVFKKACACIRKWIDLGIEPLPISVNFSKLHWRNPNFIERIIEITIEYGVPPKYIEIEFTESAYIAENKNLFDTVNKLKTFGIKTSMDDFGTGFSCLNLLKDIPVDILKLDKAFLENGFTSLLQSTNHSSEREKIIIKNVINMAKELDITVVSEGVETLEQAEFLKSINCDIAQGFYFDKPMPLTEFEERLPKKKQ